MVGQAEDRSHSVTVGTAILANGMVIFLSEVNSVNNFAFTTPFASKTDCKSYFLHLAFLNQPRPLYLPLPLAACIVHVVTTIMSAPINQDLFLVLGIQHFT